jgi:hypothetical protein
MVYFSCWNHPVFVILFNLHRLLLVSLFIKTGGLPVSGISPCRVAVVSEPQLSIGSEVNL